MKSRVVNFVYHSREDNTLKQVATTARPTQMEARCRADISFQSARHMAELVGNFDQNLFIIENRLGVTIGARGTSMMIEGPQSSVELVENLLRDLYQKIECGEEVTEGLIDAQIRAVKEPEFREILIADQSNFIPQISIKTRKKTIVPRTAAQAHYMMAMQKGEMIFALGPAGTGKTYLAVAQAVSRLMSGEVEKLILSRPAVEAGEKLGFLPGDMKDKVDPYLRPIYDALHDCMPSEQVDRRIANGEIEVAPLAFMRGRTLANAFVILDEAQNTSPAQMKMFLTRFGEGSRMIICGDPNQSDIPGGAAMSGLNDAVKRLNGVEGITLCNFNSGDVVRHPIVGRIVQAYEG